MLILLLISGVLAGRMYLEIPKYLDYFRFACYLQPFEVDATTHQYAVGTSFDQIVELYQFDKELSGLIFTAIQDVELLCHVSIIS